MPRERSLPKSPKCKAHSSRTGKPCKRYAILGGTVCLTHGGSAPRVREKAAQVVRDMLAEARDPNRVLREAGTIAYSDIRELFDAFGNFLPMNQWPDHIARAVASVEVIKKNVTTGDGKVDDVLKVRLWDKVAKLTNLMKHHGQLVEHHEIGGLNELLSRLDAGRRRNAERKQ